MTDGCSWGLPKPEFMKSKPHIGAANDDLPTMTLSFRFIKAAGSRVEEGKMRTGAFWKALQYRVPKALVLGQRNESSRFVGSFGRGRRLRLTNTLDNRFINPLEQVLAMSASYPLLAMSSLSMEAGSENC